MNKIRSYIQVNNLKNTVSFLTQVTNLFEIETIDDDLGECILYFKQNNTFALSIKEKLEKSTLTQKQSDYLFALEVNKCRIIYERIKNQATNYDWKISQEFFGEYLTTPIGDQFALVEKMGSKILFFDKVNSE